MDTCTHIRNRRRTCCIGKEQTTSTCRRLLCRTCRPPLLRTTLDFRVDTGRHRATMQRRCSGISAHHRGQVPSVLGAADAADNVSNVTWYRYGMATDVSNRYSLFGMNTIQYCARGLLCSSTAWVEAERCSDKYMNNASEQETGHTKL